MSALPQDWSFRHLLHSGPIAGAPVNGQFRDPRTIYNHLQRQRAQQGLNAQRGKLKTSLSSNLNRDWSFTLGSSAGMAEGMSPAKYSFDINATPDCANDFVIYTVAAASSGSVPNIVGFTNLYSGTSNSVLILPAVVNGATESGNTVTITAAPPGISVGQQVAIAGVGVAGYNGTFTVVSVPSPTTFTYTNPISGLANSGGGTATPLGICGARPSVTWAYQASTSSGVMKTSPVLSLDGHQGRLCGRGNRGNVGLPCS